MRFKATNFSDRGYFRSSMGFSNFDPWGSVGGQLTKNVVKELYWQFIVSRMIYPLKIMYHTFVTFPAFWRVGPDPSPRSNLEYFELSESSTDYLNSLP